MRPPRDGDFYINNANQDFWLRENGVWVRKGNIRDEGSTGLVGITPILTQGFTQSAQVDRWRYLAPAAEGYGFNMAVTVDQIRQVHDLAASMALGYNEAAVVQRIRNLTDASALGFSQAVTLTHAGQGHVVIGLASSPWALFYDSNLALMTPSWTLPSEGVKAVEFSPDKSLLVLVTTSALFRYDMTSGTPVYLGAFPSPPAWAHLEALAFSADSTRLAVIDSQLSPYCWVYNTSTWASVTAPTILSGSQAVAFNGTAANKIAVLQGSVPNLKLFDTPGMGASATQPGNQPTGTKFPLDFSPDGAYVAINGSATPSDFRIYQMSSLASPLANPAAMPHDGAGQTGKSIRWNHAGTKLTVCDVFGTYCYRVSGTTITQDQTINFNVIAGVSPAYKGDDTKLFLTNAGSAPRFQVFSISGNVYTADSNPASQPATDPLCIATSL